MTERYDAIVVGAGLAGAAAAAALARGGARAALIPHDAPAGVDPGDNGTLWGHDLDPIFPGWWESMPFERHLVEKRLMFLDTASSVSVDYHDHSWDAPPYAAHTVRRARTEPWLREQVARLGAPSLSGPAPEALLRSGSGPVAGVRRGGEALEATVTIVTEDPAHQLLPRPADRGGAREYRAERSYPLGGERIDERFGIRTRQGIESECVLGFLSDRVLAGGHLRTNGETVTVGATTRLESDAASSTASTAALDALCAHPSIAPYLEGSSPSATESTERRIGARGRPALVAPGLLVAGRAAGLRFTSGWVHQELNYEVRTGALAGVAALAAVQARDASSGRLASYRQSLRRSGMLGDVARSDRADALLRWNPRIHRRYPRLLTEAFHRILTETGAPKSSITRQARDARGAAGVSWWDLARDALAAGSQL